MSDLGQSSDERQNEPSQGWATDYTSAAADVWSRQHLGRSCAPGRARASEPDPNPATGIWRRSCLRAAAWIRGERLGALVESTCVRVGHGEDANPAGSSGTLPARDPDAARRDRRRLELELATGNSCASAVAAIGTSQMGTNCSNHVSLAEYQSSYGFLIIVNHY